MPFALYGLQSVRHVTRIESRAARLGGTAALVMQNWRCGYYLLYFAPFVPLFVAHRMWTAGHAAREHSGSGPSRGGRGHAGADVAVPVSVPDASVFGFERPFGEVVPFSANVWSYVTASENLTLLGKVLRFYPHGEGETFLGLSRGCSLRGDRWSGAERIGKRLRALVSPWSSVRVSVSVLVVVPSSSRYERRPVRRF